MKVKINLVNNLMKKENSQKRKSKKKNRIKTNRKAIRMIKKLKPPKTIKMMIL